jgi:hypothetical protein
MATSTLRVAQPVHRKKGGCFFGLRSITLLGGRGSAHSRPRS